jgi:hypothetical protein
MLRICGLTLATLATVTWSLFAQTDEEECRALIHKAINAHGGKEALSKYHAAQAKYKGTADVMGVMANVEGEVFFHFPDRMKNVISVDVNNLKIEIQQGYDGKVLWQSVMGMTQEIKDKEAIAEMKESLHAESVAALMILEDKEYKFSPLGETKIRDKAAVGVRVSKKGRRDVSLWFDKKRQLLIKSEHRGKDPFQPGAEANQEKYFSNYAAVQGIQSPRRMEIYNDGTRLLDLELTDTRYHERLDDAQFAKP